MCMACPDEAVVVLDALVRSAPWYKAIWHRLCGGVRKALPVSLAAITLLLAGCSPKRLGPKEMYRDPIGTEYIDGFWYCVDSRGTKWLSHGECD